MKIVFFTPSLNIGGYEKVVINYANAFCSNHQVTIACGKKEGPLLSLINPRVKVVDLNCRMRTLFIKLLIWIKSEEIDLLYIPFITNTAIAVAVKKILHRDFAVYSAQHGYCEAPKLPILRNIIIRLFESADVYTFVSNELKQHFVSEYNIGNCYVMNNPVFCSSDENAADNASALPEASIPAFAISGRLAKDKHVELAIRIIAEVNKSTPARLLVLGDGPLMPELRELAKQLGIEKLVEFKGFCNNPADMMKGCKGVLVTSEVESFGNSVIEAFINNAPAIVTSCGGPVQLIENGRYGIEIGAFDSEDVVENGRAAVMDIIDGKAAFADCREKAKLYDASLIEDSFLEPYRLLKSDNKGD